MTFWQRTQYGRPLDRTEYAKGPSELNPFLPLWYRFASAEAAVVVAFVLGVTLGTVWSLLVL